MNCTRLFVSLGLATVLLGVCAQRGWIALPSLWGAAQSQRDLPSLEAEQQRFAKLERQNTVLLGRITAKRSVILELLAGRLTLLEAADSFRVLNETPEDFPGTPHLAFYPGNSPGERQCRQVIMWAEGELRGSAPPQEVRATIRRLERELEAVLACTGTVHLSGW
jgi:hypothetical protein